MCEMVPAPVSSGALDPADTFSSYGLTGGNLYEIP